MSLGYNLHANGIRHHLLRHDGPPGARAMLLVPGITSPAITWDFAAARLAERFEVHVLDVRGRGLSEGGDIDYTLDAMAGDVLALAARLDAPVVLGHSMGARSAIRAAARAGTDCPFSGAILVDPPMSGPGRRPYPSPWSWYAESIALARRGCTADEMRPFFPSWSDAHLALRAEWLATCGLGAVRVAYDGFHTDDIHADLARLPVPARLIAAGGAEVVDAEDRREVARLNPGIEQRVVAGAGHMVPWDDMDGFLEAVLDFDISGY